MYRIFIVEDDAVIASAVEGHLRSWGWDARCAGDFGNILAEFAAFDPQLVLMDISLPSYNGYHWCGQIRPVSYTHLDVYKRQVLNRLLMVTMVCSTSPVLLLINSPSAETPMA